MKKQKTFQEVDEWRKCVICGKPVSSGVITAKDFVKGSKHWKIVCFDCYQKQKEVDNEGKGEGGS